MADVYSRFSTYEGKSIVITGGLGFLGSNLAHNLIQLNPARLVLFDAMLPLYGGNLFNVEEIKDKVEIEIADIRDQKALERVFPGVDIIFHLAGQTSHIDSMKDPLLDIDINSRGTINLLETVRKIIPQARIVYVGTRSQYGSARYLPVDEKHALNPLDIYSVDKQAGEWYHLIYHNRHGIPVTCLRLSNTYGIRHQMKHGRYGILNWFIRLALDNEEIPIYGDGKQLRNYLFVTDVINALVASAADESTIGKVYNIGSEFSVSLLDASHKIVDTAGGGKIQPKPWPEEWKKIEVKDFYMSAKMFIDDTGWNPGITFEEGLKITVDFYRKYRKHYW